MSMTLDNVMRMMDAHRMYVWKLYLSEGRDDLLVGSYGFGADASLDPDVSKRMLQDNVDSTGNGRYRILVKTNAKTTDKDSFTYRFASGDVSLSGPVSPAPGYQQSPMSGLKDSMMLFTTMFGLMREMMPQQPQTLQGIDPMVHQDKLTLAEKLADLKTDKKLFEFEKRRWEDWRKDKEDEMKVLKKSFEDNTGKASAVLEKAFAKVFDHIFGDTEPKQALAGARVTAEPSEEDTRTPDQKLCAEILERMALDTFERIKDNPAMAQFIADAVSKLLDTQPNNNAA
jgi:hypothetical protein